MSTGWPPAESLGMPIVTPFVWLLSLGALCSMGGIALTRVSTDGARAEGPVSATSAIATGSAAGSNTVPTVVTEGTPSSTPGAQAEVAALAPASPTATPESAPVQPAPLASVATLPAAGIVHAAVLESSAQKSAILVDLMNGARLREGLTPLEADSALEDVALARAQNLVANGYFDHYAPDGESAFSELAARGIRYRLAGENLARNNYPEGRTVAAAFDGLMGSPGHRANILEVRFSSVGVAAVPSGKMWIYVTVFLN